MCKLVAIFFIKLNFVCFRTFRLQQDLNNLFLVLIDFNMPLVIQGFLFNFLSRRVHDYLVFL